MEPHLNFLLLKESSSFSQALIRRLQEANTNLRTLDPPSAGGLNSAVEEAITTAISDMLPGNSTNLCIINMWPVETTNRPDDFSVIDEVQSLALHSSVFFNEAPDGEEVVQLPNLPRHRAYTDVG